LNDLPGNRRSLSVTELVLIRVTGADKPGLTSNISAILALHGVTILDIGQAEIHDSLSLGILAAIAARAEAGSVLKDVVCRAHELGLSVRFTPVTPESYEHWVQGQGKPRHIITLLARTIEAEAIARVTAIVAAHGLNIDQINRLSGRVSLTQAEQNTRAGVELSGRAEAAQRGVRPGSPQVANDLSVQIALQEDGVDRSTRRSVCFEMDATLSGADVADELAAAAGVGKPLSAITDRAMQAE